MSIKRLTISEIYTYPLFTKYVPYAPNDNFSIVVIETPFNIIHYLRHHQFSSDHNIPKDIAEALNYISYSNIIDALQSNSCSYIKNLSIDGLDLTNFSVRSYYLDQISDLPIEQNLLNENDITENHLAEDNSLNDKLSIKEQKYINNCINVIKRLVNEKADIYEKDDQYIAVTIESINGESPKTYYSYSSMPMIEEQIVEYNRKQCTSLKTDSFSIQVITSIILVTISILLGILVHPLLVVSILLVILSPSILNSFISKITKKFAANKFNKRIAYLLERYNGKYCMINADYADMLLIPNSNMIHQPFVTFFKHRLQSNKKVFIEPLSNIIALLNQSNIAKNDDTNNLLQANTESNLNNDISSNLNNVPNNSIRQTFGLLYDIIKYDLNLQNLNDSSQESSLNKFSSNTNNDEKCLDEEEYLNKLLQDISDNINQQAYTNLDENTVHTWVHNVDIYLQLMNRILEHDSITQLNYSMLILYTEQIQEIVFMLTSYDNIPIDIEAQSNQLLLKYHLILEDILSHIEQDRDQNNLIKLQVLDKSIQGYIDYINVKNS